MVQIFAYFDHVQIVPKLEPLKVFAWKYKITHYFLAHVPDVPVNISPVSGERSTYPV